MMPFARHIPNKPRTPALFILIVLGLLSISCSRIEQPGSTLEPPLTETAPAATATNQPPATPSPTASAVPQASPTPTAGIFFDGESAFTYLEQQMAFGPRWPGSDGHQAVGDYIVNTLDELGWTVEEQRFQYLDVEGRNIIGLANRGKGPIIILGAHYDTRKIADRTPGSSEAVPGAVDGASGVAVLLELARTLDLTEIEHEVWLTFFDLEDNGRGSLPGFDWIVGSTYMAENLTAKPEAMVLVDMIGDADQQLYFEGNSDDALRAEIWRIAANLGFDAQFIPDVKYTIIDDHLPFALAGIPAVDIIDFDYPYWHTVEDTADKASPESLERVGRTLEEWLERKAAETRIP